MSTDERDQMRKLFYYDGEAVPTNANLEGKHVSELTDLHVTPVLPVRPELKAAKEEARKDAELAPGEKRHHPSLEATDKTAPDRWDELRHIVGYLAVALPSRECLAD